jgi:hypothetical protein
MQLNKFIEFTAEMILKNKKQTYAFPGKFLNSKKKKSYFHERKKTE